MKILILGSGGREHALAESYTKSKKIKKVYVAPGNDFMSTANPLIFPCKNIAMMDYEGIVNFCKQEKIDLVDVAQDDVLAAGFVDKLSAIGIQAFGPTQKAAQLEWSKQWARDFMSNYNLPIPHFKSFTKKREAIAYIDSIPKQTLYIKASGLALGKGVLKTETREQAKKAVSAMKQFGNSGETFLIEEGLLGEEFSLFILCDREYYVITKAAQDHKTIYNRDRGPNTGGVGSIAPTNVITNQVTSKIESAILKPLLKAMRQENRPYKGVLYLGGIVTKQGVKIIEFNSRWGDPEAEVILPGIKTDYYEIVNAVLNNSLAKLSIRFDNRVRLSIAGCANGYPNDYSQAKGKEIFGLKEAMRLKHIAIFGSGIKKEGKKFLVNGGRIFHLVAEGSTIQEARKRAYEAMSLIYIEGNNLYYRTDIGWRDLERTIKV